MEKDITELEIDCVSNPRDLIDNCMESSMWGMEGKPSAWYSIVCLLDEVDKVNGSWTKGEYDFLKRFLRGFVNETFVTEELPRHQRVTIDWLQSNGGEDIGQLSVEERGLVNKWVDKFNVVNL